MALVKFMGPPDTPVGAMANINSNLLVARLYECPYSGIITRFRTYSASATSNFKFGLYDASNNKVGSDEDGNASDGSGWQAFDGSSISVNALDSYYPCGVTDSYAGFMSDNGVGDSLAVTHAFANPLPDPRTFPGISADRDCPVQVWGYPVPGVTSIDGDNDITTSQTGVSLVGTNLVDSAGNPTLELCNNSDYESATVKVSQTVNSTSDTGINFDVVQGALSTGTVYAFVTTALGQLNSIGFAVTLSSSGALDTPLTGTFSYSGLTLGATSAVTDAPQAGTFSYSGLTLDSFLGKVDAPQAGSFSYDGLTLDAVSASQDAPQSGSFSYSGINVDAVSAITDYPQSGTFLYSGLTLDAFETSPGADTPLPGEFSYSGLNLNAFSNATDAPQSGTFSYSGLTLDTSVSSGRTDEPQPGTFSYDGLTLDAFSNVDDSPQSGFFSYSGLDLNAGVGTVDSPQAGLFSYSGLTLNAFSNNVDAPKSGTFEYDGLLLNAFSVEVREDEVEWNSIRRVILRQIPYGANDVSLAFNMPPSWDVSQVDGVTVQVADKAGTEVIATDDCTLYAGSTLAIDVFQFDETITLDASAESPLPGEMLTIVGGNAIESVIVKAYDSTTKIVTLESFLQNDFDAGAAIYGNTVEYTADVSDTTVFTAGKTFVATWTPSGSGTPIKTFLQITKFEADTSNLEVRFSALYPRAYEAFKRPVDKFQRMVTEAQSRIEVEMLSAQMDYNRIVGEPVLPQLLMAKMAMMWVLNADEDLEDERKVINTDYANLFAVLKSLPIWTDTNQDGIKNETIGEFTSHNHIFGRSW